MHAWGVLLSRYSGNAFHGTIPFFHRIEYYPIVPPDPTFMTQSIYTPHRLLDESRINRLRIYPKSPLVKQKDTQSTWDLSNLTVVYHVVFTSPNITKRMQNQRDLATRVIGRCVVSMATDSLQIKCNGC